MTLNKQITFFVCAHFPWSGRWQQVGASGKCQCPHYGAPWVVPLVHSPAVQGAAGTDSNPSSSLKMWLKSQKTPVSFPRSGGREELLAGWVVGTPLAVTQGQWCREAQTVFDVPQHMAGLYELHLSVAFLQTGAERCLKKKKKLWLCCCKTQCWFIL